MRSGVLCSCFPWPLGAWQLVASGRVKFHRVPGETCASPVKLHMGSASFPWEVDSRKHQLDPAEVAEANGIGEVYEDTSVMRGRGLARGSIWISLSDLLEAIFLRRGRRSTNATAAGGCPPYAKHSGCLTIRHRKA